MDYLKINTEIGKGTSCTDLTIFLKGFSKLCVKDGIFISGLLCHVDT